MTAAPYMEPLLRKTEVAMRLSARNQIKGKVVGVRKGQTTGHVRIDIGNGVIITSSITNEAIDDLALQVGDDATAVIKASPSPRQSSKPAISTPRWSRNCRRSNRRYRF